MIAANTRQFTRAMDHYKRSIVDKSDSQIAQTFLLK
jgi:hypothetical protein